VISQKFLKMPNIEFNFESFKPLSATARSVETRKPKQFRLIYCEGTKTEPLYFEKFEDENFFFNGSYVVRGLGDNTISLVKKALKEAEKRIGGGDAIDKIWVVFDRDGFPPQHFNNAVQLCTSNKKIPIEAAWSNEAFELWYLLHFDLKFSAHKRHEYEGFLEAAFKSKGLNTFKYKKNDPAMYELLQKYGDERQAIVRAKQLEVVFSGRTDFANHNPCTLVYKLVEELRGL